jgi:hypothetical protein
MVVGILVAAVFLGCSVLTLKSVIAYTKADAAVSKTSVVRKTKNLLTNQPGQVTLYFVSGREFEQCAVTLSIYIERVDGYNIQEVIWPPVPLVENGNTVGYYFKVQLGEKLGGVSTKPSHNRPESLGSKFGN